MSIRTALEKLIDSVLPEHRATDVKAEIDAPEPEKEESDAAE